MARKRSSRPLVLDTSAVIYQLHGHTLQKVAVRDAVAEAAVLVPIFVRMEYLRGVILNLIEMWCLIRESVTVQDAFVDWSQKVHQERKLKAILVTVPHWLEGQEAFGSKEVTLRRLGDLVLRMIRDFDETYPAPNKDPLACVLGRLDIPRASYYEDLLLDFYERFTAVQRGVPECRLCAFCKAQQRRLGRREIELAGTELRERFASNVGFVRQSEQLELAGAARSRTPSCSWCQRLGDTLIALQIPEAAAILTADRTFVPLCEVLGQEIVLLPSLAALKRAAQDSSHEAADST